MIPTQLPTLYREHKAIAGVLHSLEYLIKTVKAAEVAVPVQAFRAIFHYLDVFPERHHHPKEETLLFPAIRARTDAANQVLDELSCQHELGVHSLNGLVIALDRFEADPDAGRWR